MRRRDFIRSLLAVPMMGAGMTMGTTSLWASTAAGSQRRIPLVVIFQRGGCDGLNTVVPYGDSRYAALRPTLAIAPPGAANGCLDLDGFFGFHPALDPLMSLYRSGRLALLPTVQYPNATRSHFLGEVLMEGGSVDEQMDGWINRYLTTTSGTGVLRGATVGRTLNYAMEGDFAVPLISTIGGGFRGDADTFLGNLRKVNEADPGTGLRRQVSQASLQGLDLLDLLPPVNAASSASYPNSDLGRKLRRLAQIIKADLGLEAATVDSTGWDTHVGQGGASGKHANLLDDFARSISTFYQDILDSGREVMILTMTEFGRTARENGSKGTDHGNAGTWMVLGENVNGGIYGDWPGLEDDQLYQGRYLAHTIDFRDVLGEILDRHLGIADPAGILKGYGYRPVGFL